MKKMEEKLKKIVEEQNLEQENPEELALLLWQVLKQYLCNKRQRNVY